MLRNLHASWSNVRKILEYRGLKPGSPLTFQEFSDLHQGKEAKDVKKDMAADVWRNGDEGTFVAWLLEPKLGVSVRGLVKEMEDCKASKAIVVCDEGVTPRAKEVVKNLKATSKARVDVWSFAETLVFVPEHVFVPWHRICSEEEKVSALEGYGVGPEEVPRILPSDPMVKYLGARRGQLIEIVRPSETNPGTRDISFRLVR